MCTTNRGTSMLICFGMDFKLLICTSERSVPLLSRLSTGVIEIDSENKEKNILKTIKIFIKFLLKYVPNIGIISNKHKQRLIKKYNY